MTKKYISEKNLWTVFPKNNDDYKKILSKGFIFEYHINESDWKKKNDKSIELEKIYFN